MLRNKQPAQINFGVDIDEGVVAKWSPLASSTLQIVHARAESFLETFVFRGDEVVYCDPPYHPATRRRRRVYRHDYTAEDHERLATILARLPCKVVLSGYANPVYESVLRNWSTCSYPAKTHRGVVTETLWFNFEPPQKLHDARFLGVDFRDRQTRRRRMRRLQQRIRRMDPIERAAFVDWLHQEYPPNARAAFT